MSRIVGLDYGDRRLGFAVSDEGECIAFPLEVATCANVEEALKAVERVCAKTGAGKLVIGMPVNMNGTSGPRVRKTLEFIELLSGRIAVPIESWDERLSTRTAEQALIEGGASRQKRKGVIDKLAAQVILQAYLDAHEQRFPPDDES